MKTTSTMNGGTIQSGFVSACKVLFLNLIAF
jgi:hypothetical protein